MLEELRDFALRGNVVDLAVAVAPGAAFGAVVTQLVESLITPLVAAIGGQPDFGRLAFTVNESRFTYGAFLNASCRSRSSPPSCSLLVVEPVNALMARLRPEQPVDTPKRDCPECLSSIPAPATRCSFRTAPVAPAA